MKNQHIIASASAHTRITNLVVLKIQGAVSIFSEAPVVEIERKNDTFNTVIVKNEHSHMLTFAEIDTVREALDSFVEKYKGMFYVMQTRPYLSKDGETWLSMPVIEINVRRYEFNLETNKFE